MATHSTRTIRTDYYLNRRLVKVTKSVHANSAVLNCVNHLQLNHYGANRAEVYDEHSGVLHAVVTRSVGEEAQIRIVYKRDVEEGM